MELASVMNAPEPGNISIVLVNTSHPGNIGASARAMKNMGLSKLALVGPKEFPSGVAVGRAASAVDILDRAKVVDSLEEAVRDCGLVIGASARSRRITWPLLTPTQCAQRAVAESARHPVALVFGREDTGLSNEELQLCQYHLRIPANPDYSSLNLAAAVMVICYELRLALQSGEEDAGLEREWDQPLATGGDLERFLCPSGKCARCAGISRPGEPAAAHAAAAAAVRADSHGCDGTEHPAGNARPHRTPAQGAQQAG